MVWWALAVWNVAAVVLVLWLRRRAHPRKALARATLVFGALYTATGSWGLALGVRAWLAARSSESDPSQKARLVAEGISEAMNCLAFAVFAFLVPTVLSLVLFVRAAKNP